MPTGNKVLDNFDIVRQHLKFTNPGDFYVAHVMFRVKDLRNDEEKACYLTHEETQRLIKTYYIDSLEYFDKKVPAMKDLAEKNKARVYLIPSRKNRLVINRVLAKRIIDFIDDPNIRYDHLIRSAVCGCHVSDYKWWVLDIDPDSVVEFVSGSGDMLTCNLMKCKADVVEKMRELVDETKTRSGDEIFEVPTKSGYHIITPPFDKSKMSYLGENLKTDGMTLLYYKEN